MSRYIRIEPAPPRAAPPAGLRIALILVGLVAGGAFLALQPGVGLSLFHTSWISTFGTPLGLTQLFQLTTPLIIAGCAVAVASRAGLWNIGVEGQLFMGAWLATATAFYLPHVPRLLEIVLILAAGFVGGAAWALIPALARAFWNVNEIVTTLMLNFVATYWIVYWTTGPWSANELQGSGSITSRPIPESSALPQVAIGHIVVGTGFFIAVAVAVALAIAFRHTYRGFCTDLTGADKDASWFAGINTRRMWLTAFLLSGGLGGFAGAVMELDQVHSLSAALSHNTGYIGIVVAVLAANSFLLVIPMSFLMALLSATGIALQLSGVSSSAVLFLTGLLVVLAASAGVISKHRLVFQRTARPQQASEPRGSLQPNDGTGS